MCDIKVLEDGAIRRSFLALLALVLAGVLLAVWSGPADTAATFAVNRTGDAPDRKLSDDACDTSRQNGKQCTLRAAIQEANGTLGPDTINFNIGGTASVKTISPTSPLPVITEALTVNGYSQPGARANTLAEGNNAVLKIQLSGANAGRGANGLQISAAESTIKGLVISRFRNGIRVAGTGATGNSIVGNFIGTDTSGTARRGNAYGVRIAGGPPPTRWEAPNPRPGTSSPATATARRAADMASASPPQATSSRATT